MIAEGVYLMSNSLLIGVVNLGRQSLSLHSLSLNSLSLHSETDRVVLNPTDSELSAFSHPSEFFAKYDVGILLASSRSDANQVAGQP